MDHLRWRELDPSNPRILPRVPMLCVDETNICGELDDFDSWPAIKRWRWPDVSSKEVAGRFQAWLFFGPLRILTNLLGETFHLDDWVSENDSRYVDSTPLKEVLERLQFKLFCLELRHPKDLAKWSRVQLLRRLRVDSFCRCLMPSPADMGKELSQDGIHFFKQVLGAFTEYSALIKRMINRYGSFGLSDDPSSSEGRYFSVFWSILLLYDHICEWGLEIVSEHLSKEIRDVALEIQSMLQDSGLLKDLLRSSGRFPTILYRTKLSPLHIYRLLAVPLPIRTDHSMCERQYCKGFDTTKDNYTMQHSHDCYSCEEVGVCADTLKDLVARSRIPVVKSSLNAQDGLVIQIVDAATVKDYVAISHVWAGGLGNFESNAHYKCQLIQLHQDVLEQFGETSDRETSQVYYWLDTLCVPADQGSPLKIIAINAMAAIYSGAKTVLVLDPELRELNSTDLNAREIDVTVYCSPWMARSWTLQEGALAVDLSLKFKDDFVPFSLFNFSGCLMATTSVQGLWKENVDCLPPISPSGIIFPLWNWNSDHSVESGLARWDYENAWNQLCDRSTQETKDLGVIFAVFLGRSVKQIQEIKADRRMQALLRTQRELPTSLLFAPSIVNESGWSPLFPSCKDERYSLTLKMGDMEVEESGQLVLSRLSRIKLREIPQGLVARGHCTAFDVAHNCCYHLYFPSNTSTVTTERKPNVILLLSMVEDLGTSKDRARGISLERLAVRDDGLHARILQSFEWTSHSGQCQSPTAALNRQRHLICPHEREMHVDFESSIHEFVIKPANRLYLDIGASSCPKLEWLRPGFYPFMETSSRAAEPLYPIMSLICSSFLYLLLYSLTGSADGSTRSWVHGTAYILLVPAIFWAHRRLTLLEYQFFRAVIARMLQKTWATSFIPDVNNEDRLSILSISHPTLATLIVLYGSLLICTTGGVGYFVVEQYRYPEKVCLPEILKREPNCWQVLAFFAVLNNNIDPSVGTIMMKPICFVLFSGLLCRLCMLACLNPLEPWHRQAARSEHDSLHPFARKLFTLLCIYLVAGFFYLVIVTVFGVIFVERFVTNGRTKGIVLVLSLVLLFGLLCFAYRRLYTYFPKFKFFSSLKLAIALGRRSFGARIANLIGRYRCLMGRDRQIQLPATELEDIA